MKNLNYEMIEMRFSSSSSTSFNTLEKTSTFLRIVSDKSVPADHEDNYIVVPRQVFEFFCSIIENGKVASVNSLSATLKDGSVIFSGNI
ncbi:hypothetical protein [Methanosarcina mazei]|jgi:hypothetical protein|uniref:Uncharacterized protein n=1 Tax=Methanosarcina mazei LYC TaxID=1434114 RepID=A0A0E3LVT8_METMZ|nr:hypothetical protein [Methanosarcina mazei]AKB67596.1 hypothetical protein MSMAL_1053 [Methanosarcina mazei LYC]